MWFFFVGNWVGQDYFSPQAMAFFLYLVVWDRSDVVQGPGLLISSCRRPGRAGAVESLGSAPALLSDTWRSGIALQSVALYRKTIRVRPVAAWGRTGLMAIIILSMMVIASTHQLTPVVIIGAVILLGRSRWSSAPDAHVVDLEFTWERCGFVRIPSARPSNDEVEYQIHWSGEWLSRR